MMLTLGIFIAVALFLETASAASLGVVQTEGGKVEGKSKSLGSGRSMDIFLGIPFADAPGTFEKPRPHRGWDGILQATDYKPRCLQLNLVMTDYIGSTDCLYLNIWVPHGSSVSAGLPVMVWIYGGGFLVGGSMGANFLDNYLYSGQEIADRGNVIVVTVGYRVGTLGFLSSGDSGLPGNYGLWDQQAAIAWVHRNIRSFGGDPGNITIFGESAGGASVSFQTLTPHNKGIIRRAISQSGVALCPWGINKNPRKFAEEVAQKVKCPTDNRMAACLKMADPGALTLAGTISLSGSPDNPIVFNLILSPVIDGDFLPEDPSHLFHNAAEIDYIAGVNDMDGHIFTALDVPSINSDLISTPIDDVRRLLGAYTKEKGTVGLNNAYSTYTSNWGSNPSQETIKKTIVGVGTDYIFLVPTQAALYLHADHATTGRTYSYLFSEPNRMGGLIMPYPSWMGADHADDLQYVFGKPFTTPLGYWPSHRRVSGAMISYWTNFAKTGDPNNGGSSVPVNWPMFTRSAPQFLEIHSDMDNNYVQQKMRMPYVNFWTRILPSLPTVVSE
ncbi:bile salt-activated lipase-like [Pundamilia nyererei]|uniref:Carboxylic ester hydrolase n=1 Tax=Pundamilia nyererei TaxID=303518 RepID=A0A3B4GRC7_9CICH|nr:PREDICTED: bile salt-activated lipase-like [Pundamilia nyererei]